MRLGRRREGSAFDGDYTQLLDAYVTYLEHELGKSPRTGPNYCRTIQIVAAWAGRPFWEVTSDDLRAFKREAPNAMSTKQNAIVAYHSLHKWALLDDIDVLTRHSAKILSVVTPTVKSTPKPPVPVHFVRKLLEACSSPLEFRAVYFGFYAGTRIKESATIGPKEWRRDRLVFVGKGGKQRTVPIHPELDRVKHEILAKQPASEGVLQSVVARMRERFDITDAAGEPATSHSFRRTFADHMYDVQAVPQEVVAALLGHGSSVTQLYAPVRFEKMREAVFSVNYYSGEPVQLTLFA